MDVLFPNNPSLVSVLTQLVDQVGAEMRLEHGPRDRSLNDGMRFFGLQTRSGVVVFRHPNSALKAADWHEMLAHKLTAFTALEITADAKRFICASDVDSRLADGLNILVLVCELRGVVQD